MIFNDTLNMSASYYAETATPWTQRRALEDEIEADLIVVGGGCTGLSAALHAAREGLSVVVLEGGRVGWGASGRNGGQMIPGLRQGASELKRNFGLERAKCVLDLAFEARELVCGLIHDHRIECDLKTTGHLLAAAKPRDMQWMEIEARCLINDMNYPHVEVLSAHETRQQVACAYHGGLVDRMGGHMHPLNYTLGLARVAAESGVQIFEFSEATELRPGPRPYIGTPSGGVSARHVILAGDALLTGLLQRVNRRIMPVANYIAATAPLADPEALIAGDVAVSDSRFVVNYYRLSADGRLLFGGGERYTPEPPRDLSAFVRGHMERTFPSLRGIDITHCWGGLVSITMSRLPHIGQEGNVLFAHGYSGQGVVLSTFAGKLLAEALVGRTERFNVFADLEPPQFPGGPALRGPLHVLGMLWYALRDRL